MTIPRGPVVMLALGVLLLFDVLRVFLPSLITLFGRAGSTPPELMGLYAAAWFALPFLAVALKPRWALLGGAVGLVLARVLLQAGIGQLYVASAGVTAGLIFLYGCARTLPRQAVPGGIMSGLAFSVLVHLLLDGVDLVWRPGVFPWLAALTLCTAFLALVRLPPAPDDPAGLAPARVWFLFGPSLLLVGMAATSWTKAAEGPESLVWTAASAALMVLCVLAAAGHALQPQPSWLRQVASGIMLVCSTAILMTPSSGFTASAAPSALGILLLGPLLAAAAQPDRRIGRPGLGVLAGGLVFLVATFAYYAAYDLDLGFPQRFVPIAVSVLVAAVAVVPFRHPQELERTSRAGWVILGATVVLAPLVLVSTWRPVPAVQAKQGDTVTLITYNIRMGFGLDGRLSLDDIAAWAGAQRPDVVLLSEVDRGWLLNGGHDDLARIARGLGMRHYFAPAADSVWGDALLTNLPVRQVHSHRLGEHDYPTGAQAQAIVLDVGGKELGIVNTHLQAPGGQAPEVASIVRDLAAGKDAAEADLSSSSSGVVRPVILAGDLNIRPGDPAMDVLLSAGLSDPLIALGDPPTSPADAPTERIDHVLITKGLTALSAQAPRVPYSDHLPVLTTLRLTSVDQEG
ncbi:endonuclease/exonuclease/phosphatase family protein [Nonomuraea sp. LPB2021202275-12-8]|uniref:endonuclease/exonuclease/phosphatase family protein n=1 Tax=Nonomuraea sp. LPB2021202275-12-8 TaxID=3120159 RepID=UPI00300D6028